MGLQSPHHRRSPHQSLPLHQNLGRSRFLLGRQDRLPHHLHLIYPIQSSRRMPPSNGRSSEAEGIKIPLCMLASNDELKKHVEIFGDQIHGWMAARADLEDERVKSEYERGYKTLLEIRFMAGWLRVRIWRMRGLRASMREDIRRCWSSLRSIYVTEIRSFRCGIEMYSGLSSWLHSL